MVLQLTMDIQRNKLLNVRANDSMPKRMIQSDQDPTISGLFRKPEADEHQYLFKEHEQ